MDPTTQYEICSDIFINIVSHEYSRDYFCRSIIAHPEWFINYEYLKERIPKLWERLYRYSSSVFEDIVVVSGTELIDVTLAKSQNKEQEDLFVCLLNDYNAGYINEYLISEEYNMNNTEENSSSKNYSPGRFIFKRIPDNGSVEIIGLAEKLADPLETSNIERFYLERRKGQEPGE